MTSDVAENLMLTKEVLDLGRVDWDAFKLRFDDWLGSNKNHQYFEKMKAFKDSDYDRKNQKIKDIRNIILSLIDTTNSWEVLVGKTLGQLIKDQKLTDEENSLGGYLGDKLVNFLNSQKR